MKNLMTLPLALALAACAQNAPPPKPAAPTPATDPAAAAADTPAATDARALDAYHWRLESATDAAGTRIDALFPGTDHVLTLDFAGKRIAVSGGCNGQSGGYRIDDQNRLEVARLAATIFVALLFGTTSRVAATEFAFLVGIPTMFAATAYELVDVIHSGQAAHEDWTALAVAFVASAITAFISVKWLLRYIQSHRFTAFAVYRVVFGVALLLLL